MGVCASPVRCMLALMACLLHPTRLLLHPRPPESPCSSSSKEPRNRFWLEGSCCVGLHGVFRLCTQMLRMSAGSQQLVQVRQRTSTAWEPPVVHLQQKPCVCVCVRVGCVSKLEIACWCIAGSWAALTECLPWLWLWMWCVLPLPGHYTGCWRATGLWQMAPACAPHNLQHGSMSSVAGHQKAPLSQCICVLVGGQVCLSGTLVSVTLRPRGGLYPPLQHSAFLSWPAAPLPHSL